MTTGHDLRPSEYKWIMEDIRQLRAEILRIDNRINNILLGAVIVSFVAVALAIWIVGVRLTG